MLKEKIISAPIFIFPDWKKDFDVHVDTSFVMLGSILDQPGEGSINHPISFVSRKLLTMENNYTTTERDGFSMVYAL